MAKKRGGLAGVWDRNKGVIKKVAPIAAGFIPGVGPAVGAALGAAMGGLDRPGKGGIGLDVGGAVRGGLEGYGGAKLGQAAKGGLAKMFTANPLDKLTGAPQVGLTAGGPTSYGAVGSYQPPMPTDAMLSSPVTRLTGAPKSVQMTQRPEWYGTDGSRHARSTLGIVDVSPEDYGFKGSGIPKPSLPKGAGAFKGSTNGNDAALGAINQPPPTSIRVPQVTQLAPDQTIESTYGRRPYFNPSTPRASSDGMFKGALSMASDAFGKDGYLERNERMLGGIAKGVGSVLGGRAEAGALESQTELARQKFEYEKQQNESEQERRRRIAELLMPMFTQMQTSYGG